jgi:hypothetical protein
MKQFYHFRQIIPRDKYRFVFLAFISFILSFSSGAQEKHFSPAGQAGYFEKIETIFKASSERKRADDFLDQFEEFWQSPSTHEEVKETIIEISDLLYEKKARAFPDYHLFLTTIQSFVEKDQPDRNFLTWKEAAVTLLNQPRYYTRHFVELLKTTKGIIDERKIFSTSGTDWYSRNPKYAFRFSEDTLYLEIESTKLACHSRNDSIEVFNTGGELNILSGMWYGKSGKITWERSGFPENKVYATFNEYTIDMNGADFTIDNVTFYNTYYFNGPLKGDLKHKVMFIPEPSASNYPRFTSYEQLFQINNIHPDIHYKGGFSQHGAKFLGSGTNENPATISIYRNDTLFISAKSLVFSLREDEILSRKTETTIHLDTGQIHHPGLEFKYMVPGEELYLIRSGEGISKSPFFDTYHKVSIDSEVIYWNRSSNYMELRMLPGSAQNYSFFESLKYYREAFFNKLQGMDAVHPLFGLRNCFYNNDQQPFTADQYARFLNMPLSQVRQQVLQLSFHGFVDYNPNTDTIRIQERLTDYIQFRMGKKDYDVIRFKSVTPGNTPNARFDLRNYDLALNGVESISISDHQNVVFRPRNQQVTLKYNRNFSFNGHILAGMIELFGDGFFFSYDDFRIDMTTIDSMRMNIGSDKLDEYGRPMLRPIDNTIAGLSGYLKIDTANNKSGLIDYPHFPVLVSNKNSYVYYDKPDIQNGAYNKEDFYFELEPFEIDSLNELNRKNIVFNGKLKSNIFPVIEDQLLVRNDYSLGFVKQSPPNGYPIYQNKATFTHNIDLSNKGLKGEGRLDYQNTSSESKEFTFLPHETKGVAHTFNIEPQTTGVEYPDVQGKNVQINYLPDEDKLLARQIDDHFNIFQQETSLEGGLTYTPNGLQAKGKLHMPDANLISDKMDLTHHALMADSADFNLIGGEDIEGVSFKTNNLAAQLNFEERQGRFRSRDIGNIVEFTDNRYIAYISEFSWDMDNNDIYMGASGSEGNRFVSTDRRQDSLDFIAPLAVYDMESKTIKASEVSNLKVADANIILNDGIINIHEDAEMDPLDSTLILINDSRHKFNNAHVTIEGKYDYQGYGEYDFINGDNKTYTINFHNIAVNDDHHTVAEGKISEDKLFTFDRHFAFKGDVSLLATDQYLTFDGGTQLLHSCSQKGPQDFVRFEAQINPFDIQIPIEERTLNTDIEELSHHIYLQLDSTHVYSAFLEKSKRMNNLPVIEAHGLLRYNEEIRSFEIARKEKLAQPDSSGNILRFHSEDCIVSGSGKLDPGLDLEQVKLHASGTIKDDRNSNIIELDALFGASFILDNNSIQTMANAIRGSKATDAKPDKEKLEKRLREWTNSKKAKEIADLLQPTTELTEVLPEHIKHTLCFTDIHFKWDTPSRSYYSDGKATLGWIKDQAIAKEVDVKALISRSRGGNSFEIHIQADNDNWFFFSYNNEKMLILSSSETFNTGIQTLDIEERKMKTGLGQDNYVFQIGNNNRLKRFMEFFEKPLPEEDDAIIDEIEEAPVIDNPVNNRDADNETNNNEVNNAIPEAQED